MDTGVSLRRMLLVLVAVALAAVLYRTIGDASTRSRARPVRAAAIEAASREPRADGSTERTSAALQARLADYLALRLAGDWPALYELVDPVQRANVSLASFLDAYGHRVLEVERIEARAVRLDPLRGVAGVELHTEARLVPERLPPAFRRGLRVNGEADLRRSMDHGMGWVARDGTWYFLLDQEIVTGVDEQGRAVEALGVPEG